jgi:hypothetical protein
MQPIEELAKEQAIAMEARYETGQTYYGRGFVQLTWRENYKRPSSQLIFTGGPKDSMACRKGARPRHSLDDERSMMEGWFTGRS